MSAIARVQSIANLLNRKSRLNLTLELSIAVFALATVIAGMGALTLKLEIINHPYPLQIYTKQLDVVAAKHLLQSLSITSLTSLAITGILSIIRAKCGVKNREKPQALN